MKAVAAERARAEMFRAMCEDEGAFRSWYDGALPQVYGYLLVRCAGSVALAEELTQESFVDAVRNRHRFDGRSDPVTWVISIAKHKLADHYRRLARTERRRLRLVTVRPEPGHDAIDAAERREDVMRALRSLPPGQRAVLVYRYLDDLPVASIAARLGRSESATESLLARGRDALRREIRVRAGEDTDG